MSKRAESSQEPPLLYKYLSLAPGQTPEWQARVEDLLSGAAFLSSPADFNDPFDSIPFPVTPVTRDEVVRLGPHLIEKIVAAHPDEEPRVIRAFMGTLFERLTPQEINDLVYGSVADVSARLGVLCMAENHTNVLMWSHYANNHRGIAIRFDSTTQSLTGLKPWLKVKYREERPSIRRFFENDEPVEAMIIALCTKARFWEYEKEWRLIESDNARTKKSFDPRTITGVILGARILAEDEAWLRSALHGREIELLRATPSKRTFDLEIGPA